MATVYLLQYGIRCPGQYQSHRLHHLVGAVLFWVELWVEPEMLWVLTSSK